MKKIYDDSGKKETTKYSTLVSTQIIRFLAMFLLAGGLVCIVIPLVQLIKSTESMAMMAGIPFYYIGATCIILSALLFVFCNIADDIHLISYNLIQKINADNHFQRFVADQLYKAEDDREEMKNIVHTISSRM